MSNSLSVSLTLAGVLGSARVSMTASKNDYQVGETAVIDEQVVTNVAAKLVIPGTITDPGVVVLQNMTTGVDVYFGNTPLTDTLGILRGANSNGTQGGVTLVELAPEEEMYLKTLAGSATIRLCVVEREIPTTTTTTTAAPTTTTTTTV